MEQHPNGIFLEADTYNALEKTIIRDCRVLESFKIMDYSLLVGVHNLDIAIREKQEEKNKLAKQAAMQRPVPPGDGSDSEDAPDSDTFLGHVRSHYVIMLYYPFAIAMNLIIIVCFPVNIVKECYQEELNRAGAAAIALNRSKSINRQRLVAHSTAMESIQADSEPIDVQDDVP